LLTKLSTHITNVFLTALLFAVPSVLRAQTEDKAATDTLVKPAVVKDSTHTKKKSFILESQIIRSATDSVVVSYPQQKAWLYGDAKVEYGDITLRAAYIEIDFQSLE